MRLLRFSSTGPRDGVVVDGAAYEAEVTDDGGVRPGGDLGDPAELELLAPVSPATVICVGRNYAGHIAEMGRPFPEWPFFFLKGPGTVIGPDQAIRRPAGIDQLHFEAELAMVIGRTASRVPQDAWEPYVRGYMCANDVTVRDWQNSDGQWGRAKGADTFCPMGPYIETEVDAPEDLGLRSYVNGEIRQDGRTDDLVFDLGTLLSFITSTNTLQPGDVVLTGTPAGVGNLEVGDVVEIEIDGLGRLRNPVEAAPA